MIIHVVITALFISFEWMARLAIHFTRTQFAVNCHSRVSFVPAEPDVTSTESFHLTAADAVAMDMPAGHRQGYPLASPAVDRPIDSVVAVR